MTKTTTKPKAKPKAKPKKKAAKKVPSKRDPKTKKAAPKKRKAGTEKAKTPPVKKATQPKKKPKKRKKAAKVRKEQKRSRALHRQILLEYLSNPELEWGKWPTRTQMAEEILHIAKNVMYEHFSPEDLSDIETEAFILRMRGQTRGVVRVLGAQERRAVGYDKTVEHVSAYKGIVTKTNFVQHFPPEPKSATIVLDRVLGKVPDKTELSGVGGGPIDLKFTEEFLSGLDVDELKTLKKIIEKNRDDE